MFDCGCKVEHMSVDFNSNTGALHLSEGQTPHVHKTAASFTALDENINRIEVYVDGQIDAYILYFSTLNQWAAVPPTEKFFGEIK
jgi:hypothetical protein